MQIKDTENNIIFLDYKCSDFACNRRTQSSIKYAHITTTNANTVFVSEPYPNKLTLVLLISWFSDLTSLQYTSVDREKPSKTYLHKIKISLWMNRWRTTPFLMKMTLKPHYKFIILQLLLLRARQVQIDNDENKVTNSSVPIVLLLS